MIAASGGRPAILEGELPEGNRTRERIRLIGIAASSTSRSLSWVGPLAAAQVAEPDSLNHGSAAVAVNVALIHSGCCRTGTIVLLS